MTEHVCPDGCTFCRIPDWAIDLDLDDGPVQLVHMVPVDEELDEW